MPVLKPLTSTYNGKSRVLKAALCLPFLNEAICNYKIWNVKNIIFGIQECAEYLSMKKVHLGNKEGSIVYIKLLEIQLLKVILLL